MSTIDRRHVMLSLGLGLALLAGCEQKGPAQNAYRVSLGRPRRAMNSGKAASALAPRTTFVV